ncbi:MAG: transglycosylase domain-containing protein [Propionibacteriaceae bacterium]|jgi:membrane peptidoglycan carboxypeptidase|nr:transglycosylase domain-containing protein [Propionibacteriaceae bacterium]
MPRSSLKRKAVSLGSFLVASALAGVLVAGLAIPGAAFTGMMASAVATSLQELPAPMETPPPSERSMVYLANGQLFAQFYELNRIVVPLEQIAPVMQKAQIAIEDDRFFEHGALDMRALVKAVLSYFGSSDGGGGSTLTQQYVKQVLMSEAEKITDPIERADKLAEVQERSIERKVREMRYALALEERLTKEEILERYLNIAYYGDLVYGVEAAAQHYFAKHASELNLAEAAMLAGIVQTPARNPVDEPEDSIARRDVVLDRMLELGLVSEEDVEQAKEQEFDQSKVTYTKEGCYGMPKYGQLCRLVWNYLMLNPALGKTPEERAQAVKRDGYTIQTYINTTYQDIVQQAILDYVGAADPVVSTMTLIQPGTGIILAAAQNRSIYGHDISKGESSYLSFAIPDLGGDQGYQAGSTFKGFTTAAALKAGIPPSKRYDAAYSINFGGRTFRSCEGAFPAPSPWNVHNTSQSGVMDMRMGAANSVNTYFVQLEQSVGICETVTMARDVGVVTTPTDAFPDIMAYHNVASFTLGVGETSTMAMATAYATFAARGLRCDPIIISGIRDREGEKVETQSANCRQVVDEDVADGVNDILQGTFTMGYGTGVSARLYDRQAAGKSGTTDNRRDAWFVGYTPEVAGVINIGVDPNPVFNDFYAIHGRSLEGLPLPSGRVLSGSGAYDATKIWRPAMAGVLEYFPATAFHPPSAAILKGRTVEVPEVKGMTVEEATKILVAAGFIIGSKKKEEFSEDVPKGSLIDSGCEPYKGGFCEFVVSKGPKPNTDPTDPPTGGGGTGGGGRTNPTQRPT